MNESSRLFKFFSALHTLSCALLVFLAGVMVIYYKLPGSGSIINGLIATEAWVRAWEQTASDQKGVGEIRDKMAQKSEEVLAAAKVAGDAAAFYPGYTMLTTGQMPYPVLVDMEGKVAHRWKIDTTPLWGTVSCMNVFLGAARFVDRADAMPNGDVIAQYGELGSPYGCGIVRTDKEGKPRWHFSGLVHHDFAMDAAENIYTLIQKTYSDPHPDFPDLAYPITADELVKLDKDGKEIFRLPVLDAFVGSPFELMMHRGKGDGDDDYDFMHTNSIDILSEEEAKNFPLFKAGDMLLSLRAPGILAVVSQETKKVVWAYQGYWRFQHAAHFLENGNIIVLDNQGHIAGGEKHSRVIEFNPNNLKVEWSYIGTRENPFTTEKVGRVQRLPNGNTLIADSQHARLFEVTREGKIVWNYQLEKDPTPNNYLDAIYHAHRYSKEALPFLAQ